MPKIFLIDDREECIQPLAFVFARYGIRDISIYSDPFDLLNDMKAGKRPDLVITDFNMPQMNGMELLETIRQRFGDVAGIILTGNPGAVKKISPSGNKYPVVTKGSSGMFRQLLRLVFSIVSISKETPLAKTLNSTDDYVFLERVR